ncbi:MAG: DUF3737 family protein [Lachnospiraceae bacterium]|nr:DUF3737 family protein [Lachnospiraceae bacterium]
MQIIDQQIFNGERSLFKSNDLCITNSVFASGESPLKESSNLKLSNSLFRYKYPLWYCNNVEVKECTWFDMARAGVWYTNDITVEDSVIQAPKNFRRCKNVSLKNVQFPNALETFWNCSGVKFEHVMAKGDYFAMNSSDMEINDFVLDGNYSFDGIKNVTIRNSRLLTKDAFWNSENVTVYDSFISGEYLGWNSKNLTLVNCVIESEQGMCYCDNLVMKNCTLINTNLAFEYSSVEAEIVSDIESVFNPSEGCIKADRIKELIIEKDKIDPSKTKIICDAIVCKQDKPEWLR